MLKKWKYDQNTWKHVQVLIEFIQYICCNIVEIKYYRDNIDACSGVHSACQFLVRGKSAQTGHLRTTAQLRRGLNIESGKLFK